MRSRAIPTALSRETDERFEAQNVLLVRILQRLEAIAPSASSVAGHVQAPVTPIQVPLNSETASERFLRLKPPTFEGSNDSTVANNWLMRIRQIFKEVGLEESKKVAYAVGQLEKEAYAWWVHMSIIEGGENITWKRFLECFVKRFLKRTQDSDRNEESPKLKQGCMTIVEYAAKFCELYNSAPSEVPIDETEIQKYIDESSSFTAKQNGGKGPDPTSSSAATQGVLKNGTWDRPSTEPVIAKYGGSSGQPEKSTSGDLKKRKRVRSRKRKSDQKKENYGNISRTMKKRGARRARNNENRSYTFPLCPECEKHHMGICLKGKEMGCYTCGQSGHFSKECPSIMEKAILVNQYQEGPSTSVSGQFYVSKFYL